jgi:two-component system sensor histidine kinase/response regulator
MIESVYKNAKILIVDDMVSNIELLEDFLYSNGYKHIKTTTDSRKVTNLVSTFEPDLILLDLMMPNMTGFEVMHELKKIISPNAYLPILVLTADISTETKQEALTVGAKDFLSKPFDLNEVRIRIKNLLETRFLYQLLEDQNKSLAIKVEERTQELLIANMELEALVQAKLEFLNIISHEIRTPLNGIKGFTEILRSRIDSPQLQEYLYYLEVSAERLKMFSLQALLITQLRTNVYELELEEIPILMLMELTKKKLKAKIDKKNIIIEYQLDNGVNTVKADSKLIHICFESLIDNAIRFSPNNATIVIKTYYDNNNYFIEFIDNGSGFSAVALKNLFKFFGVGEKHVDQNTGLNLALIKLIMDAHQGEILVTNNETTGATVKLIFKR